MRVQSEGLELVKGCPEDATCLPPDRASGVWIASDGALVVRLRRRKNRPNGSMLKRKCLCNVNAALCPPCVMKPLLAEKEVGERLWFISAHEAVTVLQGLMQKGGRKDWASFTLKTYRASSATSMASEGNSLGTILNAGEWRSAAFLRYVDEEMVDGATMLANTIDSSDAEAE